MTRGIFISLEGGEGTGKSTQAKALALAIEQKGHKVHLTREPGGTAGAELIRELLLSGSDDKWQVRTEALLFAAARAEHCAQIIVPALQRGEWIISDRFVDSNRAYQTINGPLSDEDILSLHQFSSQGLLPDRTFILDLPEDLAAQRTLARDGKNSDRIGGRGSEYHRAVQARFRQIAVDEPARVKLIDASREREQITADLLQNLHDLLG